MIFIYFFIQKLLLTMILFIQKNLLNMVLFHTFVCDLLLSNLFYKLWFICYIKHDLKVLSIQSPVPFLKYWIEHKKKIKKNKRDIKKYLFFIFYY